MSNRVDPTAWANNKKAALERAKQIRESRKGGIGGGDAETPSFTPQTNKRPNYLNNAKKAQEAAAFVPPSDDIMEQPLPGQRARGGYRDEAMEQPLPGQKARGGYAPPNEVMEQPLPGQRARGGHAVRDEAMEQPLPGQKARGGYAPPNEVMEQPLPGQRARGGYAPPNEVMEQPLPGQRKGASRPPFDSGPLSPGSDALGKEVKKFNGGAAPRGTSLGEAVSGHRGQPQPTNGQYKSQFMQQQQQQQPQYQDQPLSSRSKASVEADEVFMGQLRGGDPPVRGKPNKGGGGGWNDDVSAPASFAEVKPVRGVGRRAKPTASEAADGSDDIVVAAPRRQPQQQQQQLSIPIKSKQQQLQAEWSMQELVPDQNHPLNKGRVSPRGAGDVDLGEARDHFGYGAKRSPRGDAGSSGAGYNPSMSSAASGGKSRLSLLKSKIRKSESGNGSRGPDPSLLRSNSAGDYNDMMNDGASGGGYGMPKTAPNDHRMGGGGGGYDPSVEMTRNDRQPRTQRIPDRSERQPPAGRGAPKYEDDDDDVPTPRSTGQRASNSRVPVQQSVGGSRGQQQNTRDQQSYQQQQYQQEQPPERRAPQASQPSEYPDEEYEQDEEDGTTGELLACPDCGRKFNPEPYKRHVRICAKVFLQKRKAFDSKKMRVQDNPELVKILTQKQKEEKKAAMQAKKGKAAAASHEDTEVGGQSKASKWKEQSKAFREAMRAAREYQVAVESGVAPPKPVVSAPDPSLIPCPHCNRRFNEKAAERHIPQCQNIQAKPSTLKKGAGGSLAAKPPPKRR